MVKATRNNSVALADPIMLLQQLEKDPKASISNDELETWTVDMTKKETLYEQYQAFWDSDKVDVAGDLCDRLERYLLSFMADQASWGTGSALKRTTTRLIAVLKIYQPIIKTLIRPPDSVFRRLEAFQRNIFRIQPHNKYDASVNTLLDCIVDVCELWFMDLRLDGYKLMANCVVYLLAKPKMTVAMLTRLNSWSDYFLLFRQPLRSASDVSQLGFGGLFRDLEDGSGDGDEEEERSRSEEAPQQPALLELEKVDYLCDGVRDLFTRADVLNVPKGRSFLTTLLTVNRDFMKVALIAIDEVMTDSNKTKILDPLADIIIKAWTILNKTGHPHRFDLEALVISDLMTRCLRVDNKPPHKLQSKFSLMVTHMYNCTETAARRMFHSNFDLMVLESVKSPSVLARSNALLMLGKCFPLISPDTPKSEVAGHVKDQVDILLLNLAHTCPDFRATACTALGSALVRAWTMIKLTERSEALKQLAGRLCCDMASVAVRLAAVKAIHQVLDKQALSRTSLIPFLIAMKVVATDEDEKVRNEYYQCLLKAVQLGLNAGQAGKDLLDTPQLLAHFIERDRPYTLAIGQIMDISIWNLDDLPWFISNALKLWKEEPAVAVKCFQTIPKTKTAEAVHLVLETLLGQIYKAVMNHNKRVEDEASQILSMKRIGQMNNAIEMAGTIWTSTSLLLTQDVERNHKLQKRTLMLLRQTEKLTDSLKEINLYRLACRLPVDEIERHTSYYKWCLQQLENTGDDHVRDGITLVVFISNWNKQEALIELTRQWLTSSIRTSKKPKSTGQGEDDNEGSKAHLGLLYLTMLMSDPDISGTFDDQEEDILNLAKSATELFLKCLPNRFSRNPKTEFAVNDKFYRAHLMFLSMLYVHRIHYKRDAGEIRDQFLQILLVVKTQVFTALNLGIPKNVIFSIQNYKTVKNVGKGNGNSDTALALADTILKALREILEELKELTKVDNAEVHTQLLGYAPTQKIQTVTLVTPGDTPGAEENPSPAGTAEKRPARGRNGGKRTKI
ncbi:hypothetical protein RvY_06180 [Ramazzottius varieornatus]|uniref:Uncharacterized protein n=1 Tax=Ramazzottius varieornatus TaxID=947166 RepID=A0A1D1V0M6_RAMVA|nr:hypothetical protein RvY_06180 [Ramazzottius varieornatus]